MPIRVFVIGAMLAVSPMTARAAATCDDFKAAMIEGARQHQAPPPTFRLGHVNSADANIQYFRITMFDDVRATVSCWYGDVGTFMVIAKAAEPMSIQHTTLMAAIGLHAYGLEDQLVDLAKASDRQWSEVHIDGGKVSLAIGDRSSFEIDSDR